jgi:hypothetical protein
VLCVVVGIVLRSADCNRPHLPTPASQREEKARREAGKGLAQETLFCLTKRSSLYCLIAGRSICCSLLLFSSSIFLALYLAQAFQPHISATSPGNWPGHVCVAQLVSGATDGGTDEAIQFWQCGVDMD